jgi:hypothetical protein
MRTSTILEWSPRVLLVAFALFLSVFALDVFDTHRSPWQTAAALFMHLLPTLLLLLVVVLSWSRSWLGGLVCLGLSVLYAATTGRRFPWSVVAVISGPLLLTALLYLASWSAHRRRPAS